MGSKFWQFNHLPFSRGHEKGVKKVKNVRGQWIMDREQWTVKSKQ